MNAASTPSGSETIATSAERRWNRKTRHTSATTTNSSISLSPQVVDRALDQPRAVVDRHDLARRRAGPASSARELRLDRGDRLQRILARAHHDDAAGDLAFAVEFGDAAPHLRTDLDARDVAQPHRHAGVAREQRNPAKVLERLQVARRAHHVLGLAQFEHRAAGFLVRAADRLDHAAVWDAVGAQPVGIEHDLVLAHHAADRRDLGHVRHAFSSYFRNQSCSARSSARSWRPLRSTSAYS